MRRVLSLVVLFAACLVLGTGGARAAGENILGKWSPVISLPLVPSSGAVLPNGKLLLWSADGEFSFGSGKLAKSVVLDPVTLAQQSLTAYAGHNMFCTGTTNLADGRVLVNGGSQSEVTSIYNPSTNSFTRVQNMNIPRGYNANTILDDGSVFTFGGSWSGQGVTVNKLGEVWTEATGWRTLSNVPTTSVLSGNTGHFESDSHFWLIPSGNGKVLYAGPIPT